MPTYEDVSHKQLVALANALGQSRAAKSYIKLQTSMMKPWNVRRIPQAAPYPSSIGDDHSPYEYSVAYGARGSELRVLLEAQAAQPTFVNNHQEALRVNERLRTQWGANLERFEKISDLFALPSNAPEHGFSLWHSAMLSPNGLPDFKIYLNPQLHGAEAADEVIDEVFARLGFTDSRAALDNLRFRGRSQDELKYISLDLSDAPMARLKVYVCHHEASVDELEQAFAVAPSHRDGDVTQFCGKVAPRTARFNAKPVSSCLAFVAGKAVPHTVTLHLPVAHYSESDAVVRGRVGSFMKACQMDELVHSRVLRAIARKPLDQSSGVQSYASYRRQDSELRLTVYLSPELFRLRSNSSESWAPVTIRA